MAWRSDSPTESRAIVGGVGGRGQQSLPWSPSPHTLEQPRPAAPLRPLWARSGGSGFRARMTAAPSSPLPTNTPVSLDWGPCWGPPVTVVTPLQSPMSKCSHIGRCRGFGRECMNLGVTLSCHNTPRAGTATWAQRASRGRKKPGPDPLDLEAPGDRPQGRGERQGSPTLDGAQSDLRGQGGMDVGPGVGHAGSAEIPASWCALDPPPTRAGVATP